MRQRLPEKLIPLLPIALLSWLLIATTVSCVKRPRSAASIDGQSAPPVAQVVAPSETLININTATRDDLEKLPGIGGGLAARIVEHREKYGRFRRAEHLLMVRGISERRFRAMSAALTVE